jgi:phytanoyl-CoA hydroxylase
MLTLDQIAHFRHEGFLVCEHFFDDREVNALKAEVERFIAQGLARNVATAGDGASPTAGAHNLQVMPLDQNSPLFRALPFHPRVAATVSQLIGDPIVKILDQMFIKPARSGLPTNWHTDNAYFCIDDPLRGTAMWIAIHDANRENGTLKVIPRAFGTEHKHHRDPDSDHHIRMEAAEDDAFHCEMAAGGVVFFCYGTPHATGPNPTDATRAGAGIHFLNADYLPGLLRTGTHGKAHVAVTGEETDGGTTRYGQDQRGAWDREVERLISR